MDVGAPSAFRSWRPAIQSPSPHSYDRSHTIDAVRGGVSKNRPNGSLLFTRYPPSRRTTWNLYREPAPTPGTTPAQIPDDPTGRRGCEPGSQPLNSPTTEHSALGAHTAKCVPVTSAVATWCAPSLSWSRPCVPSLNRYTSWSVRSVWCLTPLATRWLIGVLAFGGVGPSPSAYPPRREACQTPRNRGRPCAASWAAPATFPGGCAGGPRPTGPPGSPPSAGPGSRPGRTGGRGAHPRCGRREPLAGTRRR